MPIDLITGLPGNGKTAYLMSQLLKMQTSELKRKIYLCGIQLEQDLDLDIEVITYDQVKEWQTFDKGSLVVIDEAQEIFPQRSASKAAPEYITELSKHRHYGLDFILITQDPRLLDAWSRRLIASHRHIKRLFGSQFQVAFEWDKVCDSPRERREQSVATKKITKLDKKVYGVYKSSVEHTVKRKVPFVVYAVLAFILSFPLLGYYFYNRFALGDNVQSDTKTEIASTQHGSYQVTPKPMTEEVKKEIEESSPYLIDKKLLFTDYVNYGGFYTIHLLMVDDENNSKTLLENADLDNESGLTYNMITSNKLELKQNGKTKYLWRVTLPDKEEQKQQLLADSREGNDPLNGLKIPF